MIILTFILTAAQEEMSKSYWWLWIVAFLPGLLIFVYQYVKVKLWERKFLPNNKDKSTSAYINAYICAAVLLIKIDRRDADKKRAVLRNKMVELGKRPELHWDTFDKIWKNEIAERRIANWCKRNLNETERSDLVYLLAELAMLDGSLLAKEYEFLRKFMKSLALPVRELKGILAAHKQRMAREEAKRHQQYSKQSHRTARRPSKSAREQALEILGLTKAADATEIKKAYRSLVKKHHPDRFSGQDEAIIKAAEERFIEIQQAYEILTD